MSTRRTALLPLLLSLTGCGATEAEIANGDDPIAALAVPIRSDRYGTTYWTRQKANDPGLWEQATAYCEDKNDGEHPNCDAVRYVRMIDRMSELPEDRPNDFRLTVPEYPRSSDEPHQP